MKAIVLGALAAWPGGGPQSPCSVPRCGPHPAGPWLDAGWSRDSHRDRISDRSQRGSQPWKHLWPIPLSSCCSTSLLPVIHAWLFGLLASEPRPFALPRGRRVPLPLPCSVAGVPRAPGAEELSSHLAAETGSASQKFGLSCGSQ